MSNPLKNNYMIEQLLKNKTNNTLIQLFPYAFVGGIAFIFGFTVLFILTEIFSMYYLISAGIGFIVGTLITYTFSIFWVFDTKIFVNRQIELGLFILLSFIGLLLTELFMWVFTEFSGIYYLFSKIISSALVLG